MNYIKHLSGFFEKISKDERLNPTHVSLYVSLFQFWNACRFHNPISISRNEVMRVSKIYSKATYHKCIKELNDYGYLSYHPSYNPFKGSLVYLISFEHSSKQVVTSNRTKTETGSEQAVVPYTNSTNNTKHQTETNVSESTPKNKIKNSISNGNTGKQKKTSQSKEKKVAPKKRKADDQSQSVRPTSEEVHTYFAQRIWPADEAEKFFNHFESNGWLVGGKTPMKNWQASAKKWMLYSKDFNPVKTTKAANLHATTGKNYAEPL